MFASLLFAMKASPPIFTLLSSVFYKMYRKKIQTEFSFSFWIFNYSVAVIILMTLASSGDFLSMQKNHAPLYIWGVMRD